MTANNLSVRTGVDLVEIDRIKKAIEKSDGHFVERIFTEKEREFCEKRPNPFASYAARFAAKEAVMKVLGEGVWSIPFTDIEIRGGGDKRPSVNLSGKAKTRSEKLGVTSLDLSFSHESQYVVASAFCLIDQNLDRQK